MLETTAEVQKIYRKIINNLSSDEQLYLSSLILNDLAEKKVIVIDESDTWTQEDQNDLVAFSCCFYNEN